MNSIIEIKEFHNPHDNHLILAIVKGSEDNIYYLRNVDDVWFCPCPDFNYRGNFPEYYKNHLDEVEQEQQYKCKHIKQVESYLAEKGNYSKKSNEKVASDVI